MRLWLSAGLTAFLVLAGVIVWSMVAPSDPVRLRVAAGPEGSDSHTLLSEIAAVSARLEAPFRLDVVATSDSSDAVARLNRRDVDLAAIRGDTPVVSDIRLVTSLFDDKFQFIVRRDSRIRQVGDLAGKRLALPPSGSDGLRSFFAVVDHYDLDVSGMRWRAMPLEQAAKALLSGRVDAIFTVRSLRDSALLKMVEDAQTARLVLDHLPIAQGGAIALKRPQLSPTIIPEGALGGATPVPSRDMPTLGVARVLVGHERVDDGLVRALTAIMFENRLELTTRFSLAAAITRPDVSAGLSVPLHDGAESFYNRDQPSFIQENAEPLALGVTLLAMGFSGLLALRSRFLARQKNRADVYNHRLLDLNRRAIAATSRDDLDAIRAELADIMDLVVRALDTDDVTDQGFQSFARIHASVTETMQARRIELGQARDRA